MKHLLDNTAQDLARCLAETATHVVFAESCTGGLASAALAGIPGISQWHCGSAVTYRERTKTDWLGVSSATIVEWNVVSRQVAEQMARGVLERTHEADVAAAITGHLGPDAPSELDGVVWVAVAERGPSGHVDQQAWRHRLHTADRADRQQEAATLLLQHVQQILRHA